jgi:hypothetical protein
VRYKLAEDRLRLLAGKLLGRLDGAVRGGGAKNSTVVDVDKW